MGQIEIIYDSGKVYEEGHILSVEELFKQWCESMPRRESDWDWLNRIPIPSAVKFIADAWGIRYKFV